MPLTFTPHIGDPTTTTADALILPIYAGEAVPQALDTRLNGQLVATLAATGFGGKPGDLAVITTLGLMPARWLILTGLGTRDGGDDERIRRGFGAAARHASDPGASSLAVALPEGLSAAAVSAAVEGIALALYRFANYKSSAATAGKGVASVEL